MFRIFTGQKSTKTSFLYRRIATLTLSFLLASCYVTQQTGYYGPDTLPKQETWLGKRAISSRNNGVYENKKLPPLNLKLNHEIAIEVRNYANMKTFFEQAFERRKPYYEVLKQIFKDERVPQELLSLALVESGFRPNAKSPMGAAGLWQFMKGTAKEYGLSVGLLNDERKDPILSTIAAARMLRELYDSYHDWGLALAAYNAGPGAVDRALASSNAKDFWELSRRGMLNPETRKFVPKVFAVAIIERDRIFG